MLPPGKFVLKHRELSGSHITGQMGVGDRGSHWAACLLEVTSVQDPADRAGPTRNP